VKLFTDNNGWSEEEQDSELPSPMDDVT